MDFLNLLASIRTGWLNTFFSICTYGGEEITIIVLICLLYWCINKDMAYKLSFTFLASGFLVQGLKITCRIPRPWVKDPSFTPVESAVKTATGYSFPSGHTQGATSIFTTFMYRAKQKNITILCFLAIALVMISRMYLGVHTPLDVGVSFAVSFVTALIINYIYEEFTMDHSHRIFLLLFVVILSFGLFIYSFILYKNGTIELNNVSDCVKSAGSGLGFILGWYIETKYINFCEKGVSIFTQIIKFALGGSIAFAIKFGLKIVLGTSLIADFSRYLILMLFVTILYPLFIHKVINRNIKYRPHDINY